MRVQPCFFHTACRAEPAAWLLVPALLCCRYCMLGLLGSRAATAAAVRAPRPLLLLLLLLLLDGGCAQLLQLHVRASAAQRGAGCVAGVCQLFRACAEGVCTGRHSGGEPGAH